GETGETGLGGAHLRQLIKRPSWLMGTVLLGLAIVCQLTAISFAPLIVVQPLGAVSLVITTLLNAQVTGHSPTKASITAIGLCIGGILIFVGIAAVYATERPLRDVEVLIVLVILFAVMIIVWGTWALVRSRVRALFYICAAGVLYGFVATLAKVVIKRLQDGQFDWMIVICVLGLLAAMLSGAYFVQTAYASGPPDLVIAGLTVIDPIIAVLVASLVLGEAAHVPLWAIIVWLLAAAIATTGVFMLARSHPQVISESAEFDIERGTTGSSTALDVLRDASDPPDLMIRRPGSADTDSGNDAR
ncbi:MAG: multidrug DMT transporter permease, partial [Microbacterium sp.]